MHKHGPYKVKNEKLVRGNVPVENPALLIHKEDSGECFSTKVGTKVHIIKCFRRYAQAHPEMLFSVNMFEFTNSMLSLDAICTICNAAINKCAGRSLEYLLAEDVWNLNEEIMQLQAAGY